MSRDMSLRLLHIESCIQTGLLINFNIRRLTGGNCTIGAVNLCEPSVNSVLSVVNHSPQPSPRSCFIQLDPSSEAGLGMPLPFVTVRGPGH